MPKTVDDLLKSENPYEHLTSLDQLKAFKEPLDALPLQKKNELASNIIFNLPDNKQESYTHLIQSILSHYESKSEGIPKNEFFFEILFMACQIKKVVLDLWGCNNKEAYQCLLPDRAYNINISLFNRFMPLTKKLLATKGITIAENLALHTPEIMSSQILQNIEKIFPNTIFLQSVQNAFRIKRQINYLLGDHPEVFFSNPEFNHIQCKIHLRLFNELTPKMAEKIGKILLQMDKVQFADIQKKLDLLTSENYPEANPFWLIAKSLNEKYTALSSLNTSRIFTPSVKRQATAAPDDPLRAERSQIGTR